VISIVIPALNEEQNLNLLLQHLKEKSANYSDLEIIVADGGSIDQSKNVCEKHKVKFLDCGKAQRASQLNVGASNCTAEIFYFLHADSFPPENFDQRIKTSIKNGSVAGCFTMKFKDSSAILSFYCWFTRFKWNIFRGGDQSLFVRRAYFEKMGGYNEGMDLLEDYEIIKRINDLGKFEVITGPIFTSSRKYKLNGEIRLQWVYFRIQMMYRMGFSQKKILAYYKKKIRE